MPTAQKERARKVARIHGDSFRCAYAAGVKIACGADVNPVGFNTLAEIELMVKLGMTEADALRAATLSSARCCGFSDIGLIEPGYVADLVALSGNPFDDIAHVRSTHMVVKSGKVVERSVALGESDIWDLMATPSPQ